MRIASAERHPLSGCFKVPFDVGAVALLLCASVVPASGQLTIGLSPGSSTSLGILPGGTLVVPLVIDMSKAAGANVATITLNIVWPSAQLTLGSMKPAFAA